MWTPLSCSCHHPGRLFGWVPDRAHLGGSGERGGQAVAGPKILFGHEAGEERVDLGQHGGALRGPVIDEAIGCGVVGAHVAVRTGADEGARDLGQAEAEGIAVSGADELQQVGGDTLPVADRRPVVTLPSSWVRVASGMISLGCRPWVRRSWMRAPSGWRTCGWSRESAATTVVLISWVPGPG
jgi:hypothetical protein